jgi:hypothetical protein
MHAADTAVELCSSVTYTKSATDKFLAKFLFNSFIHSIAFSNATRQSSDLLQRLQIEKKDNFNLLGIAQSV